MLPMFGDWRVMTDRMEALWRTGVAGGSSATTSLARKPSRVWRYPYPSATSSLTRSTRRLRRNARAGRSLLDPVQESHKQTPLVAPVVVTEYVFVQIRLKVFGRNSPVYAAHTALYVRPEALNRVRVDIATYVDLLRMRYAVVLIPQDAEPVVRHPFVRVDDGR